MDMAEHALEQLGITAFGHRAKIKKALRGLVITTSTAGGRNQQQAFAQAFARMSQ